MKTLGALLLTACAAAAQDVQATKQADVDLSRFPITTVKFIPKTDLIFWGTTTGEVGAVNAMGKPQWEERPAGVGEPWTGTVTCAVPALDGKSIYYGGEGGLWRRTIERQPKVVLRLTSKMETGVLAMEGAASGEFFVTVNGKVRVWKSSGALLQTYDAGGLCVSLSPDGAWIALGGEDGVVYVLDNGTGKVAKKFEKHRGPVYACAFSPDGKTLASGSCDRTVKLWNFETGENAKTFSVHAAAVNGVAFHPSGKFLASASDDRTVRIWNCGTGEPAAVLRGHHASARTATFSADGKTLAAGGGDGAVILWAIKFK